MTETRTPPKIVVVGAGFAGLNAVKALAGAPVEVLLIDQNNYHTFQPLLYQVATSGLEPGDVAQQARGIFHRQRNVGFRQGTVVGADWERKVLLLAGDEAEQPGQGSDARDVPFDYLILAPGAVYNDFGVPGVLEHAYFIKSLSEAVNVRSHILRQFERVSARPELVEEGALNFVLVGGGPTGVEMAGALVELLDGPLRRDFKELEVSRAKVILIEMTDRLLNGFEPRSSRYAQKVLAARGVELRLGETVAAVRAREVELKSGEVIPTETLIWAAGVRGHPLAEALRLPLGRGFRVALEPDLSVPGRPYVFVAGDLAGTVGEDGKPYPQVAQVAIQQGKHAARQILRRLEGHPGEPFRYLDRGIMAIIGRNAGVAELAPRLGGFKLRGFLGWLGWLFIHLLYLPGHMNRFMAFTNWAYNYLTYDRHARLITFMRPSMVVAAPSAEPRAAARQSSHHEEEARAAETG